MTRQPQTVDETGWTHVSPRSSKRKPFRRRRPSLRSSTPPPPLPPHDELLARINRIRIKVRELDVLSDVIRTVGSVHSGGVERGERKECLQGSTQDELGAEMEGKTHEILLLGLGHLDLEVGMWQLALALELMEGHYTGEVAAKRRKPQRVIKTYDPVWSAEEIGFLNTIPGVEVIDLLGLTETMKPNEHDEVRGSNVNRDDSTTTATRSDTLCYPENPIILVAPHLELDVLSDTFGKLGQRIVAAVCNDLRMGGLEKEIEVHKWEELVLKEVKDAAQGRAFNHLAVYVPSAENLK